MLLECRKIKEKMLEDLKVNIKENLTLAIIQIGDFASNEVYLRSKRKLATLLNVSIKEFKYQEENTKEEIINKIKELNKDSSITAIMIQKPILKGFDYQELVDLIEEEKDIDGVSKKNQMKLKNGKNAIIPCTCIAVLRVLEEYKISLYNRKIIIIGKSSLAGMPLYEILKRDNKVVLCDSKTENLLEKIKENDIVITGIGKPYYFQKNSFRENQVVIDIGTSYLDGKLVGDVDYKEVENIVSITPVPGGVGLLTPVCLFENLLKISNKRN